MNTKQILVIAGNLALAVGILVLVGLGRITWPEGLAGLGLLAFPSAAGALRTAPPAMCLLGFVALGRPTACKTPPTPTVQDATTVANDACTLIEATTDDGTVRTICATIEEIGVIANIVETLRADGGPPKGVCTVLPTTKTCATAAELARGIDAVNARRAASLRREGGAS
jgi:hypothetical protein